MIFQKSTVKNVSEEVEMDNSATASGASDEVETVVGPSVNVEGDFASEGNIIVKGTVAGSVHTSRFLSVEMGAKIMANVRAGSAKIAGEVKGNLKVRESLELTSTARVMGDIEVKVLSIEPGALLFGKVTMPGLEGGETRTRTRSARRGEEMVQSEE
ncbi:MAG: polymer-forming cytoskeletal protein [Candidatus Magasanikbacteria bacterium]|nr:polymer-forming cytoskeletal protein [Candidatus Magasanikbacteria bacterium]